MNTYNEIKSATRNSATLIVGSATDYTRMILGNDLRNLQTRNFNASVFNNDLKDQDKIDDVERWIRQSLNEDQLFLREQQCKGVKLGMMIITGMAGCGKTHMALVSMAQSLIFPKHHGSSLMPLAPNTTYSSKDRSSIEPNTYSGLLTPCYHQHIIVTPTNNGADHVVESTVPYVDMVYKQFEVGRTTHVVHLIDPKEDERVFFSIIDLIRRPKEVPAQDKAWTPNEGGEILESALADHDERPSQYSKDRRIKNVQHYASFKCLQLIGRVELREQYEWFNAVEAEKYSELRILYDTATRRRCTEDENNRMRDLYWQLWELVVSNASVVVGTPFVVSIPKIAQLIYPVLIVFDECFKTPEPETISVLVKYVRNERTPNFIFVGDHKQLGPFSAIDDTNSNFAANAHRSFTHRMTRSGFTVYPLTVTERACAEISDLVSRICYEGMLKPAPSRIRDPIATSYANILQNVFKAKRSRNLWCVNVETSPAMKYGHSNFNIDSLRVFQHFVISAIQLGVEPTKIMHLYPYTAQGQFAHQMYESLGHYLGDKDIRKKIQSHTIDGSQGQEAPLVFLDLVNTSRIGFVDKLERFVVGVTRAQYGLVVIGNFGSLLTRKAIRDGSPLADLWYACKTRRSTVYVPSHEIKSMRPIRHLVIPSEAQEQ